MRPLRAGALAAALFCAGPAAAETVALRAGEHGAYTRLVVPFAAPGQWRLFRDIIRSCGHGQRSTCRKLFIECRECYSTGVAIRWSCTVCAKLEHLANTDFGHCDRNYLW